MAESHHVGAVLAGRWPFLPRSPRDFVVGFEHPGFVAANGLALRYSKYSDRSCVVHQDSDGPVSRREDVPQGAVVSLEGTMARSDGARRKLALSNSFSTR